jgi:hypothetical protein
MEEMDKLRVMLPHWIEHNGKHGEEFSVWAEKIESDGATEVASLLKQAVGSLQLAEEYLQQALEKMGGPLSGQGHHHHH